MSRYRGQLLDAARAARIRSQTTFTWCGQASPRLPAGLRATLSRDAAREHLVGALTDLLYTNFYTTGRAVPAPAGPARPAGGGSLMAVLVAANAGTGQWQPGWQVTGRDGIDLLVTRQGLTVRAGPGWWRPSSDDPTRVRVRRAPGSGTISQGYYVAWGDTPFTDGDQDRLLRLYWHLRPGGAAGFLRAATSMLNRLDVPATVKVLHDQGDYHRCDAGVLYLRRGDYRPLLADLQDLHRHVAGQLDDPVPALTKRVAAGVGLAEGPPGGASFGRHRCALIAAALVTAHERHTPAGPDRLTVIRRAWADQELSIDAPYLQPGAAGDYPALTGPRPTRARPPGWPGGRAGALGVAVGIAHRLCTDAVRWQDRCGWLDQTLRPGPEPQPGRGRPVPVTQAVPAGLYQGGAGIGLFLAEVAAVTGEPAISATAVAALRQALTQAGAQASAGPGGLYTGGLGVAVAAARAGLLLAEPNLLEAAARLTEQITTAADWDQPGPADLLTGDAGTVIGLLTLARLVDLPGLHGPARVVADRLDRAATATDGGLAWPDTTAPGARALTGLSHGAAGVAYALTIACRAFGNDRYRDTIAGAFRFEQHWYHAPTGAFADLRNLPAGATPPRPWPAMTAWCHGSPGIALARAAAAATFEEDTWRAQATAALAATAAAAASGIDAGPADFTLCHGLAGLAETWDLGQTLLAGQPTGNRPATGRPGPAAAVADLGATSYARGQTGWPCGTGAGVSPSLMLGLAGIGWFYLRRFDPDIPSPLLPDPDAWARTAPPASPTGAGASRSGPPAPPGPAGRPGRALLNRFGRSDQQIRDSIAAAAHRAGLTRDRQPGQDAARWQHGRQLRDAVLPRRLPGFAEPYTHLLVAEIDPHLWNSLPAMLAFGYEQAQHLLVADRCSATDPARACWTGAVFSSLLSVFDYLVDETDQRHAVYQLEQAALNDALGAARAGARLSDLYTRYHDPRLRLLLSLFGMLRDRLADPAPGRAELVLETRALFAAERAVTLGRFTDLTGLRRVAEQATAVGTLPFRVLARAVAHAAAARAPSPATLAAATRLGRAVGLADDLADLLDDCDRGAPNQVVLRLADLTPACGPAPPRHLDQAIEAVTVELAATVAAPGWPGDLGGYAHQVVTRWLDIPTPAQPPPTSAPGRCTR